MLCQAASQMAVKVIVLDPQENFPASQIAYHHMIGSFDDSATVQQFAKRCGVLTVEIEHVDVDVETLENLEQQGVDCQPKASTIRIIQDKYLQKVHFSKRDIPLPEFMKFEVGGDNGWQVPESKEEYNQWASKNRFKIEVIVHFNYSKDSVMAVTEEEYDKCRSERPIFYSKNGNTEYKLDRAGLFYFMSGVKGQRMIIKVLELEQANPPMQAATDLQKMKSGVDRMTAAVASATVVVCFVSFLAVLVFY